MRAQGARREGGGGIWCICTLEKNASIVGAEPQGCTMHHTNIDRYRIILVTSGGSTQLYIVPDHESKSDRRNHSLWSLICDTLLLRRNSVDIVLWVELRV